MPLSKTEMQRRATPGSRKYKQLLQREWESHELWDDLRFPVSGINPPGQASDPDIDATNGGLLFAAAGTETIVFQAQMPHGYEEGTPIIPHCHWMKTSSASGDVVWRFEYKVAKIGETMDADFTAIDASTTVGGTPDNDTEDEHLITSFGEINPDLQISDMLLCKLSRIGNDASDTYGADCRLIEVDIHHRVDSPGGSYYQFIKQDVT